MNASNGRADRGPPPDRSDVARREGDGCWGYVAVAVVAFLIGRGSVGEDAPAPLRPLPAPSPPAYAPSPAVEASPSLDPPARAIPPERPSRQRQQFIDPPAAPASGGAYYRNCAAARAAGAAPVLAGEPGYSRRLDRDGDGVGCE